MTRKRVPGDAIYAAAVAMAQVETGPDGVTEPNEIDFLLARIALEAAAPHLVAPAWDAGFTECARQFKKQRDDPSHPITLANPWHGEA